MLDFVKRVFSDFFEVILWINLILCTAGGGIVGQILGDHILLGALIGIIVGLLTDIGGGGLVATILNIDENLEKIKQGMGQERSSSVSQTAQNSAHKKCPFCAEEIKADAKFCHYCSKNVIEYETELKTKEIENHKKSEAERKERIKTLQDIFKDESIMKEAMELRRMYGKAVYINHLKNKAKALGLGDIEINENNVE